MNKEKFGVFLHATSKFLRHWCAGKGSEMVQVHYCTFQSRCCAMVRKGGLAVFRCFIARERKISRRYFSKYINIIIDIFITNKLLLFYYVKYYIFKNIKKITAHLLLKCVDGRCSTRFRFSKKHLCILDWLPRFRQTFRNNFQWNQTIDLPAPNQVFYFLKQVGSESYIQGKTKHLKQDTEVSWEQNKRFSNCPPSVQHNALQLPHSLLKHFMNDKKISKEQT